MGRAPQHREMLSSQGPGHDEIDFEFLGNSSGNPCTLHTNVYAQGKGNKEQQFHLWSDPTTAFHTYSIVCNPGTVDTKQILFVYYSFLVDNSPIREFRNNEAIGVPFPTSQRMRVYSSLWNADDWAMQGGRSYRNFNADGCVNSPSGSSCISKSANSLNGQAWRTQELDPAGRNRLRWVQRNFMIYD
ncbi:hypothetical protein RJ639_028519 [Escallonia herrerae]|uniref:xyloglucan:xyloglucosyl transferase n=1 Tax=Escallonia herrerae TaxID=1293975 RepID=A0AA88X921_9ASTE|nr:hypothetical protein RJ639_028519 [Escallonia herrerae]